MVNHKSKRKKQPPQKIKINLNNPSNWSCTMDLSVMYVCAIRWCWIAMLLNEYCEIIIDAFTLAFAIFSHSHPYRQHTHTHIHTKRDNVIDKISLKHHHQQQKKRQRDEKQAYSIIVESNEHDRDNRIVRFWRLELLLVLFWQN